MADLEAEGRCREDELTELRGRMQMEMMEKHVQRELFEHERETILCEFVRDIRCAQSDFVAADDASF